MRLLLKRARTNSQIRIFSWIAYNNRKHESSQRTLGRGERKGREKDGIKKRGPNEDTYSTGASPNRIAAPNETRVQDLAGKSTNNTHTTTTKIQTLFSLT
jgi:hypothetical protein